MGNDVVVIIVLFLGSFLFLFDDGLVVDKLWFGLCMVGLLILWEIVCVNFILIRNDEKLNF